MTDPTTRSEIETSALSYVLTGMLKEQRASRRWSTLFKGLAAAYVLVFGALVAVNVVKDKMALAEPHVAVIHVSGTIGQDNAGYDELSRAITSAMESPSAVGVALRLNSPGGAPVAAGRLFDEIRELKLKHSKPVISVMDDLCASACYYIAAASDTIYADKASLVGSIGVRMDSFGFTGLMDKLGVERRVVTAGANKALLDPFLPMSQEHVKFMESRLAEVHKQFIAAVELGRGAKLKHATDLYSGLIWEGTSAQTLGLVDEIARPDVAIKKSLGDYPELDYTPRTPMLARLLNSISPYVKLALPGVSLS